MTLRLRSGRALRLLVSRLTAFFRQRRSDEELNEEIKAHLDLLAEDYMRRGMSIRDARDAARRSFGSVDRVKAAYREQRGLPMFDALSQDIKFALRVLGRDRSFALTAILVLGLGIGVNNMLFTMVYAHTMRGLPIEQPGRVLHISAVDQRGQEHGLSYPEFDEMRRAVHSFAGIAAFSNTPVTLSDEGRAAERFMGTYLSTEGFDLAGARPVLGRAFTSEDDRRGAPPVVILGRRAWETRYSSDASILGRVILVNGTPSIVIGVMPEPSGFPSTAQVWVPIAQSSTLAAADRNARALRVFGRVRDGISVDDARTELEVLMDRIGAENPPTKGMRARVVPINDRFSGRFTDPAWLAFTAASFLVVIISCSNVANLLLARAVRRARDLAIRASLGASRRRIARQLLVESVLLAILGGTLGLGISLAGIRMVQTIVPEDALPYWLTYTMDSRVFGALCAVSFGSVLLFGFVPAFQTSRTDVNHILKAGGRAGSASRSTRRWTTAFLTAQFALTVILLSYVVNDIRTSPEAHASDAAINTPDLVTASIALAGDRYRTAEERVGFYRLLKERIRAVPSVKAVSIASAPPLGGAVERHLDVEGQTRGAGETAPSVWTAAIDLDYFRTLGLSMARGREFAFQDGSPGQASAIVNQRFADMFFANADPIGRRVRLTVETASGEEAPWLTIVGVSPFVRQREGPPDPVVYVPLRASAPPTTALIIRTNEDLSRLTPVLRDEVRALDPGLPLYRVRSMPQAIHEQAWVGQMSSTIVRFLTLVALGLAVVGLYAATAHTVAQQTPDLAVRMALGAQPRQVGHLIVVRALGQVTVGLIAGILCAIAWDAVFFSGRVDRRFADLNVLAPVALVLAAVTVVACVVPVRRATRLNPVTALRQE